MNITTPGEGGGGEGLRIKRSKVKLSGLSGLVSEIQAAGRRKIGFPEGENADFHCKMASKTPKFSRLRRAIFRGTSGSFVWNLIRLSDSLHLSAKDKVFCLSVEYPLIALLLSMKREEISTAEHKSSKRTLDSKLVLMKDNCSQSYCRQSYNLTIIRPIRL